MPASSDPIATPPRRRPGRRRRRQIALAAFVAVSALVASLLFIAPPSAATHWVMNRSSGWLLAGDDGARAMPVRAGRKLVSLWLQHGIAAQFHAAQDLPEELSDVDRIAALLGRLRPMLISQSELEHAPLVPPVAVAGLGWCDTLNGFAGTVLAHEFPRVEIVAVVDGPARTAHSFGRVWSRQAGDWLYFDMWPEEGVIFRSRPGRRADYLAGIGPGGARRSPAQPPDLFRRIYDRAHTGIVHNRLQPTLGGYVFSRVVNLLTHGDTSPAGAQESVGQAFRSAIPTKYPSSAPNRTVAGDAYVRARTAHLAGDLSAARSSYEQVVRSENGRLSTYGRAARIFADRIDAQLASPARRRLASGR